MHRLLTSSLARLPVEDTAQLELELVIPDGTVLKLLLCDVNKVEMLGIVSAKLFWGTHGFRFSTASCPTLVGQDVDETGSLRISVFCEIGGDVAAK